MPVLAQIVGSEAGLHSSTEVEILTNGVADALPTNCHRQR